MNRLAVLILNGSIEDGEVARVVLEEGKIAVLANHEDTQHLNGNEDAMIDDEEGDEAADILEGEGGNMDLYDD